MLTLTGWYRPDQVPARAGWYLRDHRRVTSYTNDFDRVIALDYWEPDPAGSLHPGVWYVQEDDYGFNDASHQRLPWRGLTGDVWAAE